MAALTAERDTQRVAGRQLSYPVLASTQIFKGSLVGIQASSGFLVPMTAAAGIVAIGKAAANADNSSGANGDLACLVEPGVYLWANHGTNTLADTDIGAVCYGEDDQTVGNLITTRSVAGRVVDVVTDGVWVKTEIGGL